MDKREAKLRALLLCEDAIAEAFDYDRILDMVDEDTTDDEAKRIYVHIKQVKDSLRKRIDRLQARLTQRAVDVRESARKKVTKK